MVRTFYWQEIKEVLWAVNLPWMFIGGGLSIMIFWLLRTVRWCILLRHMNSSVPFVDLYFCTSVSLSLSIFTPLQSGEMFKIELLKKNDMISRLPGYASFLIERIVDLGVVLIMASLSLLFIINILPNRSYIYFIVGIPFIGFILGIIFFRKLRLKGRLQELLNNLWQGVGDLRTLFLVLSVSFLSWASVAASWLIILYSGSIKISFVKSLALMSIVTLISILSLVPGGFGISEVSIAQILKEFGITAVNAQAGAIILRLYSLVAISFGLAHFGIWKLLRMIRYQRIRQTASDEST